MKSQPKSYFKFTLLLCISLLISIAVSSIYSDRQQQFAAPFNLADLAGTEHRLSDYQGQVLIVNFWASWCVPCREEIPAMNRANTLLKENNVQMLAINYGEDSSTVLDFLQQTPIEFTVLLDTDNRISKAWDIKVMPTTLILNSRGKIIERVLGPREWDSPAMIERIKQVK